MHSTDNFAAFVPTVANVFDEKHWAVIEPHHIEASQIANGHILNARLAIENGEDALMHYKQANAVQFSRGLPPSAAFEAAQYLHSQGDDVRALEYVEQCERYCDSVEIAYDDADMSVKKLALYAYKFETLGYYEPEKHPIEHDAYMKQFEKVQPVIPDVSNMTFDEWERHMNHELFKHNKGKTTVADVVVTRSMAEFAVENATPEQKNELLRASFSKLSPGDSLDLCNIIVRKDMSVLDNDVVQYVELCSREQRLKAEGVGLDDNETMEKDNASRQISQVFYNHIPRPSNANEFYGALDEKIAASNFSADSQVSVTKQTSTQTYPQGLVNAASNIPSYEKQDKSVTLSY